MYSFTLSLTSALDGVGGQRHGPGPLPIVGGWVGPRIGVNACGKILPPLEFDRRTVQSVASRYTN